MLTPHHSSSAWYRSPRFWFHDWGGRANLVLSSYVLVYCLWLHFQWGGPEITPLLDDLAYLSAFGVIMVLIMRVVRQPALSRRTRRAWGFIFLACLMVTIVLAFWFYYETVPGMTPFPSWLDILSFISYWFLMAGLVLLPSERKYHGRAAFWLDAAIVIAGVGLVIWHFILRPIVTTTTDDVLAKILALAYPLGDALLIFGVTTILLSRPPASQRMVVSLVGLSMLIGTAGDLFFAYMILEGAQDLESWVNTLWMGSLAPLALGAHAQYWETQQVSAVEAGDAHAQHYWRWLPYVAVVLGCSVLLNASLAYLDEPVGELIIGVIALTALVVGRQIIAMRDNARLLVERVARQSEARFASLVQNASDVIAIVEADGTIRYVTPSARRIYGYAPESLVGRHITDLVHPEDVPATHEALGRLLKQTVSVAPFACRVRHLSGAWLDIETTGTNLLADPLVAGLVLTTRDISERKAREAAEAANKAKSAFLAHMSHELRTPLTAVIGYTELLQYEAQARGCHELIPDLEKIYSAGQHLLALINNILILSKIEAGKLSLSLETFDVVQLIRDVVNTVQPLVAQHENELVVDCAENLGMMHADATRMRQILLNVLSNAAKFTHRGTISLHVRRADENGKALIQCIVADTGIGMTLEQQQRLFQPFTQASDAIARTYGGTGLGLAICKHYCQAMGGTINIESEAGQGTTVTVHLPTVVVVHSAARQDQQARQASSPKTTG